jgi:hypothetical protein
MAQVKQVVHLVHFSPQNARNTPKKAVFTLILRWFLGEKWLFLAEKWLKKVFFAWFLLVFDGK